MPRRNKLTRQDMSHLDRQRQAWELRKNGASFSEIGRAMGISRQHAHRLINKERDTIAAETRADAQLYKQEELARMDGIIREASRIMNAPCGLCNGTGMIRPDADATLPGFEETCNACFGLGKRYGVDYRLKAMDKITKAVETRSRLLGLFAPDKVAMTDSQGNDFIRDELKSLSDDELDAQLKDFLGPGTVEELDALIDAYSEGSN